MAVSHEALDAHGRPRAANHVRQMLVAHGVLPPRHEQLAALEHLNARTVSGMGRADDRKTVAAFATWRVLRRVRRRADHHTNERTAISHARNQVLGATRFLDWLAAHGLTLATCTHKATSTCGSPPEVDRATTSATSSNGHHSASSVPS